MYIQWQTDRLLLTMRLNRSDLTIETPKEWKVRQEKAHSRWQALTVAIGLAIKPVALSGKWVLNRTETINNRDCRSKVSSGTVKKEDHPLRWHGLSFLTLERISVANEFIMFVQSTK